MTIRRYKVMRRSIGTQIPNAIRMQVRDRDQGCVGPRVGMPDPCFGGLELDHIRASHGIGMKSPTTVDNLAQLCSAHHLVKTEHGKTWRPKLLAYVEKA